MTVEHLASSWPGCYGTASAETSEFRSSENVENWNNGTTDRGLSIANTSSMTVLGQRLRTVRVASGWSLRDLQAKIHNRVTAQAISQYERGESIPSDDVLRVLSQALGVSVAYLTGTSEIVLEGVEFRSKREIGRREQARIQARVLRRLERYLAVEEALRLPNLSWDRPRAAPFPMKGGLPGAEHAAGHVRAHWGLGITPIPNLAALLEDRGIKVVAMSLDTVDGMTARARQRHRGNQVSYVIVVNGKKPGDRQRFTMAHELGHMVLDAPPGTAEKAAHQFAAAFLMPRDALLREVGWRRRSIGWSELFALQRMFRVSAQALTRRCEAVGVFRATLARRLYHEFARRHWSTYPFQEPVEISRERPERFERLCFRGVAERALTGSEAAELLGMTTEELTWRMESAVDHGAESRLSGGC